MIKMMDSVKSAVDKKGQSRLHLRPSTGHFPVHASTCHLKEEEEGEEEEEAWLKTSVVV